MTPKSGERKVNEPRLVTRYCWISQNQARYEIEAMTTVWYTSDSTASARQTTSRWPALEDQRRRQQQGSRERQLVEEQLQGGQLLAHGHALDVQGGRRPEERRPQFEQVADPVMRRQVVRCAPNTATMPANESSRPRTLFTLSRSSAKSACAPSTSQNGVVYARMVARDADV